MPPTTPTSTDDSGRSSTETGPPRPPSLTRRQRMVNQMPVSSTRRLQISIASLFGGNPRKRQLPAPHGPVYYDSSNGWEIITKCYGSAWPKVLPYCIFNTLVMLTLSLLKSHEILDASWGITKVGHTFAGAIVGFLLVTRINNALGRYDESRSYISQMYLQTRELTQYMVVMSRQIVDNQIHRPSKEWRMEVAYRALVMLRTAMAVVRYNQERKPAWEVPELTGVELDYTMPNATWRRHAQVSHHRRTDSMRIPIRLAYLLRESIVSQNDRLAKPLPVPKEVKLLTIVDSFSNGYYGIRSFITTPVPFPLIQMSRTIVLFYICTVPLVFLDDAKFEEKIIPHCIMVFMLTYGFVGLGVVSVELDDPFGDDDNDFDVLAYAKMCFEDTYLLIDDTDGQEWADALRYRLHEDANDPVSATEESVLIPSGGAEF